MKKAGKKILKVIGIMMAIILILIAVLVVKIVIDQRIQEKDQQLMVKSDEDLLGQHIYIDRENKESVDVNFYSTDGEGLVPLVINLHGGAFVAGDADTLDSQSARISADWDANIATINYSLLKNGVTKEYVIEEITDTVKYFINNADSYGINTERIYILGYSAGGYYAMASTLSLLRDGIYIRGQILCYAFISDILEQFGSLNSDQQQAIPQTLFLIVSGDPISEGSLNYEAVLKEAGVSTEVLTYENVKHGFIEENNPEYDKLHKKNKSSKSESAEAVARQAENNIYEWMMNSK